MHDLLVIGSGPGGYVAALRAAQFGLKTAVIERAPQLGGACLHVGCIPTKTLLYTAEVYEHFLKPEEHGISCENVRLDWAGAQARKDRIVQKHAKGIECLFRKHNVERIAGHARLRGGGRVEVDGPEGKREMAAKHILLATGSEARMLPGLAPDAERVLTNVEILNLKSVPKSLTIS